MHSASMWELSTEFELLKRFSVTDAEAYTRESLNSKISLGLLRLQVDIDAQERIVMSQIETAEEAMKEIEDLNTQQLWKEELDTTTKQLAQERQWSVELMEKHEAMTLLHIQEATKLKAESHTWRAKTGLWQEIHAKRCEEWKALHEVCVINGSLHVY